MWTRSENAELIRPLPVEESGDMVIVRKEIRKVEATEEMPEHYTWKEWQMSRRQYEVHQYHEQIEKEQSDAIIELAELVTEVMG